jgi:hypothetical protein
VLDLINVSGQESTMKRPLVGAVVLGVLAAGGLLAGAVTVQNTPIGRRTPTGAPTTPSPAGTAGSGPATAAHSTVAGKSRPVDLRYSEDGRYVTYDYAFDGGVQVFEKGGLGAAQDGPVLARATVTTSRQGRTGAARITIRSDRVVRFSPSNFTWLAPGVATGPTTWRDVTLPAGTHTHVLTFEDVAKGRLDWNLNPTENFDWPTR